MTPTLRSTPSAPAPRVLRQMAASAMLLIGTAPMHATADSPASPKIFRYMQGGTTAFSDVPPSKIAYVVHRLTCYACSVTSTINWHATPLHLQAYGDEIAQAARQYGLEPSLVRAVIHEIGRASCRERV